jgi:DNA-binding NtrC family response regulator
MMSTNPGTINGNTTDTLSELAFVSSISPEMQAIERTMIDMAATDVPVLITGESGTGKGAMALRMHQLSRHRDEPFIKINCSALALDTPGNLWTQSGTVFLDEVSDLDPASQSRLLQLLPDGELPATGHGAGVRLIACTRHKLEQEVRALRFREDLYYRVKGVCLRLPPLRQRKADIPALLEHFLAKYSVLLGRAKPEIGRSVLGRLVDYSWPGNIRELEYTVQKIIALGDAASALADLGADGRESREPASPAPLSLKETAREASRQAERELILKVLARTRWNRKRAAQELQISYKALLYKLKQMGMESARS